MSTMFTTIPGPQIEVRLCLNVCDGESKRRSKNNVIWVIIGRLTQSAHFIAMVNTKNWNNFLVLI